MAACADTFLSVGRLSAKGEVREIYNLAYGIGKRVNNYAAFQMAIASVVE
jgi:hypothetical protein